MIRYSSTRGNGGNLDFEQVLLAGLAPDGGLYVADSLPAMTIAALKKKSYAETAEAILFPFLEESMERKDLKCLLAQTYSPEIFTDSAITPVRKLYPDKNIYVMELFHGPTLAFKDIALQFLGRLFDYFLDRRNERVTIIGATSGDTGSAAIAACCRCKHANIFVLFPQGRVSDVQRRQMTTVKSKNVNVIAIEGNFDACQTLVKQMFADTSFRKDMNLSAVNSINWARVIAQSVYYIHTALLLGAPQREVNFVVPTGNFGNALAGHYARKMGIPLKVSVATNENDILARFFANGVMERRDVCATISPSMDIGISSNFERYLFELMKRDAVRTAELMDDFCRFGRFEVSPDILSQADNDFLAYRAGEDEIIKTMQRIYQDTGYSLDPHTAVATNAALKMEGNHSEPVVIAATAHPAKFPDTVEKATGIRPALPAHLVNLMDRPENFTVLPADLGRIQDFIRIHEASF